MTRFSFRAQSRNPLVLIQMKTSIILVAAGKGERFGQAKWSVKLAGRTLLERNLDTLARLDFAEDLELVIVVPANDIERVERLCSQYDLETIKVLAGGHERSDSVHAGVEAASGKIVIIHNVANPLAEEKDFKRLRELLLDEDIAGFVGQEAVDTLRRISDDESETIERDNVWLVQTPQAFRRGSLLAALKNKRKNITDEVKLFEDLGIPVKAIKTNALNKKITYSSDLEWMEQLFANETLVGIGEDSHPFDDQGDLILAAVTVKKFPKLKGNSDGDLILHALFNAISSALGQGSIANTADKMCQDGIKDSAEYLKVVLKEMRAKGYELANVSLSLECQRPKIDPLADKFKSRLSELLYLEKTRIGITATSGEKLTSFARGEGIKCQAVVSLIKL